MYKCGVIAYLIVVFVVYSSESQEIFSSVIPEKDLTFMPGYGTLVGVVTV